MYKPYKVEMVDFCRPMEMIEKEIEELEKKGFLPVSQVGYYVCYANPNAEDNKEYEEQILKDAEERKREINAFWNWMEENK